MRLFFIGCSILLLVILGSCGPHLTTDDGDQIPKPLSAPLLDFQMERFITDSQRVSNFYRPLRTFYYDNVEIGLDSLSKLYKQERISVIFTDVEIPPREERTELSDGTTFTVKEDSTEEHNATVKFSLRFHVQAFSQKHVEGHGLVPSHVQLFFNKYDNLFLSLTTAETGPMNAIVYDKMSGELITSFSNSGYDGSFHIGQLSKLHNGLDSISLLIKVGDLISHQDFSLKDIIGDGVELPDSSVSDGIMFYN